MADREAEPAGAEEQVDGEPEEELVELDLVAIGEELAAAEGFVEERVQRALAPYQRMFPPAVLEEFADDLRCFLLTHPVASKMLARIRPRAERATSGEGVILHAISDDGLQALKGKGG